MPSDAVVQQIHLALDELHAQRTDLRRQTAEIEAEIKQHENALAALIGGKPTRHARSGAVILAALATYSTPVTTTTLRQHPDLVHYAEPSIRRSLTELHRRGLIVAVERTPKGQLWTVASNGGAS